LVINIVAVDGVLENLALQGKNRFNAYQIASLSNEEDIDAVNEYLLIKAKFDALIIKIETLCPSNHPDLQLDYISNGIELSDEIIECRICDEEYIPDIEFTNVVFYFNDEYVENLKKKLVAP
jgi:hypothetical protein